MKYCVRCGKQVDDVMNFCPECGAKIPKIDENTYEYGPGEYKQDMNQNTSKKHKVIESGGNRALAILSYLGILVFVPVLSGSKSEFVRFHANQGLVLFVCNVIWNALRWLLSFFGVLGHMGVLPISLLFSIINFVFIVLMIIGIVNACESEKKELPLIGNIVFFN